MNLRSIGWTFALALSVGCGEVKESPDASTVGAEAGAGEAGVACGNGMSDPNEECDNGADNGPGKACTALCKLNVCGDGDRGPTETCDTGTNTGANVGDCAADCSKLVDAKRIVVSVGMTTGNLGANPVATADSLCPVGHRALFVAGTARRATTMANASVDPVDWVIKPWTQYRNATDQVIWQTREVPLLGVVGGAFTALMNPISATSGSTLTGLAQNWTTLQQNNCGGWTNATSAVGKNLGIITSTSVGFINNGGVQPCDIANSFYCVEQ